MKNLISRTALSIVVMLSFSKSNAQIDNSITESVKIYGNCGMCEKNIESAGNVKKIAIVDWNKETKMATLTYDPKRTNQDEILKRIASAGYDSDQFLAPEKAYNKLAGCCQYDRTAKNPMMAENTMDYKSETNTPISSEIKINQLDLVFDNYFALKDALVQTDSQLTSKKSADLLASINAVNMGKLEMDVHMIWMKVVEDLKKDAKEISEAKKITVQRTRFMDLSKKMYDLMKISKSETEVYYQFCPMADNGNGANWLSKDKVVKNPYYGSQMLSCGKTVETIK